MDIGRGCEMDDRRTTLRIASAVHEIVTPGGDIKATMQWVLDFVYFDSGRDYRIVILPAYNAGEGVVFSPAEALIRMGSTDKQGLGNSSPNIIRRDWPESGGEDLRQVRPTANVESNGAGVVDGGGGGEGPSEETDRVATDKEFMISDTALRMGVEAYLRSRLRGSLWMNWDISNESRRRAAAEWLYNTIREVIEGEKNE